MQGIFFAALQSTSTHTNILQNQVSRKTKDGHSKDGSEDANGWVSARRFLITFVKRKPAAGNSRK